MSYQVLARKYRPKNFETLVGQEHVVRALTHALVSQRLHHAYLFTGTRGVGKTTLSRILAKSLNCIGIDGNGGITAQPCGVCHACTAIDAGRFVDYIEMDAASNRGVDEMASLLDQAVYAPSNARFKVYMIDEVHMLTNHAFNAMLKTLEEPPEHVKFILATTDPQKIPVTVLSRCLQFNLKQMPPGHIIGHLEDILGQEQIEFEQPALRLLAQGAHGSMRDALSLTDQAIAYAAGKVTLDAVQGMLGALDQSFLVRVLDALAAEDGADLLAVADEMAARSLSYNAALQDLGTLLHRIALAQTVPGAVPDDLPEREAIMRLATVFDAEEVQLFYQIVVHGRNELGLAPDEYAGFSMTLLRMLAFRPAGGVELPPAPSGSAPRGANTAAGVARAALAPPAPVARAAAPVAAVPVAASAARAPGISPGRAALEAARAGMRGQSGMAAPAPVTAPVPIATSVQPFVQQPAALQPTPPRPAPVQTVTPQPVMHASPPPWEMDAAAEAQFDTGSADFFEGATQGNTSNPSNASNASNISAHMPDLPDAFPDATAFSEASTVPPSAVGASNNSAATSAALRVANNIVAKAAARMAALAADPDRQGSETSPADVAPAVAIAPVATVAAVAPPFNPIAIPGLAWDGDWPELAKNLAAASAGHGAIKGVIKELAYQSELINCQHGDGGTEFRLRVPLETLGSPANVEKLALALSERFTRKVQVSADIGGPVWHTAHARALAAQEVRQRQAEQTIQNDPFVQSLMREFGATVVPGSIRSTVSV
jgi:DNA polymerase-3 subunit gamma/tau